MEKGPVVLSTTVTETPPPAATDPDDSDKLTEAADAAAPDEPTTDEADRPTDATASDDATVSDDTDKTNDADQTDDDDEPASPVAAQGSSATPAIVGAIVAILVIALGIWGLSSLGSSSDEPPPNVAAPVDSAAPTGDPAQQVPSGPVAQLDTTDPTTPPAACKWTDAPGEYHKEIGKPPTGEPRKGTGTMTIETTLGNIEIAMNLARTPCTAWSMKFLSDKKFYSETTCHRLTGVQDGIGILQCGDPTATGGGGPTYEYADENLDAQADQVYERGVVAMANYGPNTNGSQFFINFKDGQLANAYTPFGVVTKGMDIVDHIASRGHDNTSEGGGGRPVQGFSIIKVTVKLG